MEKKIISISHKMKGGVLDDDYTLYEDGTVLHEYDKHAYPGGQNFSDELSVEELSVAIKHRLLEASTEENRELVQTTLKLK